jgi:hemerythrin-like metal-binding protein
MAIELTPRMATGARTVDDDHRRLVHRANALLATAGEPGDPSRVDRALREFGNAAVRHFSRDEDCTVREACPAVETNGLARAELIAILARFREDFERGGAGEDLAAALETSLGGWIGRYLPPADPRLLPCIALE